MRTARTQGKKLKQYISLYSRVFAAVLAVVCFLIPAEVYAACSATGLFTLGDGTGKCTGGNGIFANILCTFESTLSEVLSRMYCAFQDQLKSPLASALSLATVIFGICVFTGYIEMNVKDVFIVVIKLALVWALAMNSDYGILWVGKFFMGVLQEGTNIAIAPIGGNVTLTQPDSIIKGLFNFMSNPDVSQLTNAAGGGTNDCGVGTKCMSDAMLKNFSGCAAFLMTAGVGILVFMPVIIIFVITVIFQYLALYIRAVLGYLTSIVILTFLFIFAPLFLSFALFGLTKPLFQRWLQFLQTFSIQAIILFSFVALLGLATQGFTLFLYNLMGLMRPYDMALEIGANKPTIPNACSICEFKIIELENGMQNVQCLPAISLASNPPAAITPTNMPAPIGENLVLTMPTDVKGTPIDYYPNPKLMIGDVLSSQVNNMPGNTEQHGGKNYVVPILRLIERTDFMIYLVSNVIAFLVIATVFQEFIKGAPDLARALGGTSGPQVAALGGRTRAGDGNIQYFGAHAFSAGMTGMQNNMMRQPFNPKIGLGQRLKEGIIGRKLVERNNYPTAAAYEHAMKNAPLEGGFFGGFLHGAEENQGSAYYAQEQLILQAEKEREDARKADEKTKASFMAAQEEIKKNEQAIIVAEAEAKRTNNYAQLAQLKKKHISLTERYEEAIRNREASRETLRRKEENHKQQYAELYQSKTRERGVMAQQDARGNIIHMGIGDKSTAAAMVGSRGERYGGEIEQSREARLEGAKLSIAEQRAAYDSAKRNAATVPGGRSSSNSSDELIQANQSVTKELDALERQMASHGSRLTDDKRREYQKLIDKARSDLGGAKTAREAQDILSNVASVKSGLSEFSSKYVKEGAVVAGLAGIAGLSALASQTAPSMYLQQADKSIGTVKKNLNNSPSEATLSGMLDEIGGAPKALLAGVLGAVETQKTKAEHIIPESKLASESADLKAVQRESLTAQTPEENAKLMEWVAETQKGMIGKIFSVFDEKRDKAGKMMPAEKFELFDKKLDGIKVDASVAERGEDIDKIFTNLLEAPGLLIESMIGGLKDKLDEQSPTISPQERQTITEELRDHEKAAKTMRTGEQHEESFQSLAELNDRLDATRMRAEGNNASQPAAPASVAASASAGVPDYTGIGGAFREKMDQIKAGLPNLSDIKLQSQSTFLGVPVGSAPMQPPNMQLDKKTADKLAQMTAEERDYVAKMEAETRERLTAMHNASSKLQTKIPTPTVLERVVDRVKGAVPVFPNLTLKAESNIPISKELSDAADKAGELIKQVVPSNPQASRRENKEEALQAAASKARDPFITRELPQTNVGDASSVNKEWAALGENKKEAIQTRLERAQKHFYVTDASYQVKKREQFNGSMESLSNRLKTATSEEELKDILKSVVYWEKSYQDTLPSALNQSATNRIESLERLIPNAGGLISPDKLSDIKQLVDSAKTDLRYAKTTQELDSVIAKLDEVQRIITG